MKRVLNVVGARPNFMKIAPITEAMTASGVFEPILVHTGQHYDEKMARVFFDELGIPKPDIDLEVGSASHAVQTAEIMVRFEKVLLERKPDLVLVVGDVNSTVAAALVAKKLDVDVAHVEAGLRSFDRKMPEELNRIVTDALSDYLFVTESSGLANLAREGVAPEKVYFVGNVMIDTLYRMRPRFEASDALERFGLDPGSFAVLTLHRPSNVDVRETFERILGALEEIQRRIEIVFPIHPRTRKRIEEFGLGGRVAAMKGLKLLDPLGYLDFMKLVASSRLIMTDSGGIQEETSALGLPCLTLRENTERPSTVERGTNELVGTDPARIVELAIAAVEGRYKKGGPLELQDGKAAERIAAVLAGDEAVVAAARAGAH